MANFYEHGNESSVYIKGDEFIDQLNDYLTEDSALWTCPLSFHGLCSTEYIEQQDFPPHFSAQYFE